MKITSTLLFILLTTGAFATQFKSTIQIRLQSVSTGYWDQTTVYFDKNISPYYIEQEDAQKVYSNVPGVPNFFSYTADNISCSINGAGDLSTTEVIALGYTVSSAGTYKFTSTDINNFDGSTIMLLEDKKTGTFTDLRADFYQAQLSDSDKPSGRFYLHVTTPAQFSSNNATCANNNGMITLKLDNTITWDIIQLLNSSQVALTSYDGVNYSKVNFSSLAEGTYYVEFVYGAYSAIDTFQLGGSYVVAGIATSARQVEVGQDIVFSSNSVHATQFAWDFGDGTLIDGVANPSLSYYVPGTYTVTLDCSNNEGCSASAKTTVVVTAATGVSDESIRPVSIFSTGKNITVNLNGATNNNAQVQVFNLLGEAVYTHVLNYQKEIISMENNATGYYIVSVKNNGDTNTKRIIIN